MLEQAAGDDIMGQLQTYNWLNRLKNGQRYFVFFQHMLVEGHLEHSSSYLFQGLQAEDP